jgi:hypothetical protein
MPPLTVALSLKDPPLLTDWDDNWVVTIGVDGDTLTISEPHGLEAALLLPSPL